VAVGVVAFTAAPIVAAVVAVLVVTACPYQVKTLVLILLLSLRCQWLSERLTP
jgi:hypothetical protein